MAAHGTGTGRKISIYKAGRCQGMQCHCFLFHCHFPLSPFLHERDEMRDEMRGEEEMRRGGLCAAVCRGRVPRWQVKQFCPHPAPCPLLLLPSFLDVSPCLPCCHAMLPCCFVIAIFILSIVCLVFLVLLSSRRHIMPVLLPTPSSHVIGCQCFHLRLDYFLFPSSFSF